MESPTLSSGKDAATTLESMESPTLSGKDAAKDEPVQEQGLVSIGVMTRDDFLTTLTWAAAESWNPGQGDAGPFFNADKEGFFMVKTQDGEPVASVSAVRYGEDYGFIGFYVCTPKFRGKGHGLAVFRRGMSHLEGRLIGLDAVVAQQGNYAKMGFVVAHENYRFGGVVKKSPAPVPVATETDGGLVLQKVEKDSMELVVDFDRSHVVAPRADFVREWLTAPGHVAMVAIEDGTVKGYGVLRPSHVGARVGPLFAGSAEVAELLAKALTSAVTPGTEVFLDIPEPNGEALRLAERLGLYNIWKSVRMYRGTAPDLPLDRIFAVTSLELG